MSRLYAHGQDITKGDIMTGDSQGLLSCRGYAGDPGTHLNPNSGDRTLSDATLIVQLLKGK
jgi:hypothetical protein